MYLTRKGRLLEVHLSTETSCYRAIEELFVMFGDIVDKSTAMFTRFSEKETKKDHLVIVKKRVESSFGRLKTKAIEHVKPQHHCEEGWPHHVLHVFYSQFYVTNQFSAGRTSRGCCEMHLRIGSIEGPSAQLIHALTTTPSTAKGCT